jgi:tetratricopeptide (TPR) repeat protein
MKKYWLIFYCLLFLLMVCCSSLPKKIESQSFTFARMKMRFAREAQKQQNFNRALRLYLEAYDLFTGIDEIEGKINAGLSIARQYFYLDNPGESKTWLNRAGDLIESNRPQMAGAKAILLVEMAFEKNDYQKVIEISDATSTPNPEWQMEILCYTLAAKAQLNRDYQPGFKQVQAGLPELQKRFNKGRMEDPEVLSFVYYYTGYIHSVEKNWQSALLYFEKAKEIDGLMDNPAGLGKDLYSLGQCYEKLGSFKKAASSYRRAAEIFNLLKDAGSAEKAKKRAESLKDL